MEFSFGRVAIYVTLLFVPTILGCESGTISTDIPPDPGAGGGTTSGQAPPTIQLSPGGGGRITSQSYAMDVQFGHPFSHKLASGGSHQIEVHTPVKP